MLFYIPAEIDDAAPLAGWLVECVPPPPQRLEKLFRYAFYLKKKTNNNNDHKKMTTVRVNLFDFSNL